MRPAMAEISYPVDHINHAVRGQAYKPDRYRVRPVAAVYRFTERLAGGGRRSRQPMTLRLLGELIGERHHRLVARAEPSGELGARVH